MSMKQQYFKVLSLISVLFLSAICIFEVKAKNYQTLPQGRSTFGYKYVVTDQITHKLDSNGIKESYSIKEEINSKQLENISTTFKSYFEVLNQISPEAYQAFHLGEYKVEAEGNVVAQGIGMGHGFTNKLTGYFALPLYRATSKVDLKQTKFSNMEAVKNSLQNLTPTNTTESLVKQFTEQIPEASGEVIQSLITNYYGYKPLGNWNKSSPGDLEFGLMYNVISEINYGSTFVVGSILPTGQSDDPDNLQDIASGDGQTDLFVENLSGVSFFDGFLELDVRNRYTHQLEETKYMRIPDNEEFPLTSKKQYIKEKLGDKIENEVSLTTTFLESFSQSIGILYQKKYANRYNLNSEMAKNILEKGSDEESMWLKASVKISTINFFKNNKFFLPLDIGGSYQSLMKGKNTPEYHRIDLDFRLYF